MGGRAAVPSLDGSGLSDDEREGGRGYPSTRAARLRLGARQSCEWSDSMTWELVTAE